MFNNWYVISFFGMINAYYMYIWEIVPFINKGAKIIRVQV